MLSESFVASIGGPPIASKTDISKDVGIYAYQLNPTYALKTSFKKSSTSPNCLAVNNTHVFAAQKDKAHVHVYSRLRGNQEALVPFRERITSLSLTSDVLLLGTAEGRLILWEVCTGRQVTTPPCHVQAISCVTATSYHVLTGSDDSNVHVWSMSRLLDVDARVDHEPDQTLSNHRGAITSVLVGQSTNEETCICVSASRDKTCVVWNYRTGEALRTLLFPSAPLCACLDPCGRGLFLSSEDGSIFAVEIFGDRPLLGPRSDGLSSTAVQIKTPLGTAEPDDGPAFCIAVGNDGTTLLTGHSKGKILQWPLTNDSHPTKLADVNASVTNLVFTTLVPEAKTTSSIAVVKPTGAERQYTFAAKLETNLASPTRFGTTLNAKGFPQDTLQAAVLALQQPSASLAGQRSQTQVDELWEIVNEQRALQKLTLEKYVEAKSNHS